MAADSFVSRRDAEVYEVSRQQEKLLSLVRRYVNEGKAEVVRREEGVLLVVIHDSTAMQKVRFQVSLLAYYCSNKYDLFMDAEVDYGECFT
ncbi:MAG: hypothetical protein WAW96_13505 [Alphaproteobacteria bacterium]